MSYTFEQYVTVTEEHLDDLNHVNNLVYLKWVQEIAGEHWFSVLDKKNTPEEGWVVYEHNIQYKKQVFLGEELRIETYIEPAQGVKMPRRVNIYRGEDLVVTARTVWILIDRKTFRPKRIDKETLAKFGV